MMDEMEYLSRSSFPSRLSRLHLWSWDSRMMSRHRRIPKQQSVWKSASISSHSLLLLCVSCQGCEDICQGGLVRWPHLVKKSFKAIFGERTTFDYIVITTITFTATTFCRAESWLPQSGSSSWVRETGEAEVLRTVAAAAMVCVEVAIQGSGRWDTKASRWGGERRTFCSDWKGNLSVEHNNI